MTRVELRPVGRTPVGQSLRRLQTVVSPYTGIVSGVRDFLHAPDDDRLCKVAAETAQGQGLLGRDLSHLRGGSGGSGCGRAPALAAALGEALERYSGSYLPEEELVLASADELGPEVVDPLRFALFHEDQYTAANCPFVPFTRETRVRWVRGFSLPDGDPAYLPAQVVYLSSLSLDAEEPPIAYSTSNGMACAATLEEAILAGLLELAERDAFMIAWYNRLSLPRLDWASDPELVQLDRRYFAPSGVRYQVVDLSAFLDIPTMLAVVRGRPFDSVALGVGAAGGTTAGEAWRKALAEAFSVRAWARGLQLTRPVRRFRPDFADIEAFSDHIHFYADHSRAGGADFLDSSALAKDIAGVKPLEGDNVCEWIQAITGRLTARAASAYAVDITAPDVRQAGLRVVKVVAPELCALDVSHRWRFLGGTRLYRAAWELGLREEPLAPADVNPYPHPFP